MTNSSFAHQFTDSLSDRLTHIELTWSAKRVEQHVRFGRPVANLRLDRHRRRISFAPNAIFAIVRWAGNAYGTISSEIDILRAVAAGERCTTAPFLRPGGEILLSIKGWPKVERVLQAIDVIEALGIDPVDAARGVPILSREIRHAAPRPPQSGKSAIGPVKVPLTCTPRLQPDRPG